jgi:putative MATE family efflux protein
MKGEEIMGLGRWITAPQGRRLLFSNRDLLHLFLPLIFEQFLFMFAGFTDSLMVASLGESAVSGVSLIDNIMILVIMTFVALNTGGAVVMGQYYGRGDLDRAREGGRQLVWTAASIAFCVMLLFYALEPVILYRLYGSSAPDVLSCAKQYMDVMGLCIPFIAIYQAGSAIFRTAGNTKISMTIVLAADVLNIGGNYLAIFVLHWGVWGAALSTLISRIFSVFVIIWWARHSKFRLRLPPLFKFRPQKELIRKILSVGIPFSVENGLFQLGKVIVVTIVTFFGTSALAANAVATALTNFEIMPGSAVNAGMTTVISRCLGAGDVQQSNYYTKKILVIAGISNLASTLTILFLWPVFRSLYGLPPSTMDLAWDVVLCHGIMEVLIWPFAFSLPVVFRAAGDAKFAMYSGVTIMMLVRVIGAYVFGVVFGLGMFGTWLAMFLDWAVRTILFIPRYRSGKYLAHKVI